MEKSKPPKFQDSRPECQATVGGESDLCVSALFLFFLAGHGGRSYQLTGKKQNLICEDLKGPIKIECKTACGYSSLNKEVVSL